jgi:gliding motility associated protien GldN
MQRILLSQSNKFNHPMRYFHLFFMLGLLASGQAQVQSVSPSGGVLDGAFVPRSNRTKQLLPYPPLDESHVLYVKRVERRIPLNEKLNHPLFFPVQETADRQSLIQLILSTLDESSSSISIYQSTESPTAAKEFKNSARVPQDSARDRLLSYEWNDCEGLNTPEVVLPSEVVAFDIKEDWIFDKHRSQWYCRIIGISPVAMQFFDCPGGIPKKGLNNLGWLYFPEWRHVFQHGYASAGTFNPYNDTGRPTFLELFEDRRFSSYIIKESNVYDRSISTYAKGEEALLESERIKNELFTMEHDLWHY